MICMDCNIYVDVMVNIDKCIKDFFINVNIGVFIKDLVYEQMGGEGDLVGIFNFFMVCNLNYFFNFKLKQFGYYDQFQSIFVNLEVGWKSQVYLILIGCNDWEFMLVYIDIFFFFYFLVGLFVVLFEMFKLFEFMFYVKV